MRVSNYEVIRLQSKCLGVMIIIVKIKIELRVFKQLLLWLELLLSPLDGYVICHVSHRNHPLDLLMSGNHSEQLVFHVIDTSITTYSWLSLAK